MKIQRTSNAKKGIIFGTVSNIYSMIVPFLMRTVMLYTLGVKYLGLNSLFTSILQVLNLTEFGVGSAMVYSMYKPIAEDDTRKICALMRLYRRYYRIIGLIVGVLGILIVPILPKLINEELPGDVNLYVLYLMNLASTVLTYWLFAYKNSLLNAFQRNDIISKIYLVSNTLKYILQIGALVFLKSYYVYVSVMLLTQILNNIITALIVDRMYPDYRPRYQLPEREVQDINHRIRDLFTQKIGGVVNNNADTIVISAFLGLTTLVVFQNYYYVISIPLALMSVVFDSCRAGIGNSLETESSEKNYEDFKIFTFIVNWSASVCCCGLICLYQHFMCMWVGEELLFPFSVVILFVIYIYLLILSRMLSVFKDAGGIWHRDRMRPLFAALLNLGLNLMLVQVVGIYGILLSTIISWAILSIPWLIQNLFLTIFNRNSLSYIFMLIRYALVAVSVCIIGMQVCGRFPSYGIFWFIIKGFVALITSNALLLLLFFRTKEFKSAWSFMKRMIKIKK